MTNNKGKPYHVNMVFGRKLDLRQGIQWNYKNKANEEERKRKKKIITIKFFYYQQIIIRNFQQSTTHILNLIRQYRPQLLKTKHDNEKNQKLN